VKKIAPNKSQINTNGTCRSSPKETVKKITFMIAFVKGSMTELMRSSIVAAEADVEIKNADKAVKNFRKRCISCGELIELPRIYK
jgi:hypothetical protein